MAFEPHPKVINLVPDNSVDESTDLFLTNSVGQEISWRVEVETYLGTDVNFQANEKRNMF